MNTKQDEKTLRYIYLGQTTRGSYSVLRSDLTPDQIIERINKGILLQESFAIYQIGWGGDGDLDSVCNHLGVQTVDEIELQDSFTFSGSDPDMSLRYNWSVEIIKIITVQDR